VTRRKEPFVFFVDRSLGRHSVPGSLATAVTPSERVVAHDDEFAQDTEDVVWLKEVSRRGWVILTKDTNLRRNEVERVAIVEACATVFTLGRGDLDAEGMAQTFIAALPVIRRALRRFPPALFATVTRSGAVSVHLADGETLKPPKQLK